MNLTEYLQKHSEPASELARRLDIAPSMLYQWRKGLRSVPVARCIDVERATGGAVTRRELRPDDWHLIWPELAEESEHA